jgi:hypothetical protein
MVMKEEKIKVPSMLKKLLSMRLDDRQDDLRYIARCKPKGILFFVVAGPLASHGVRTSYS